MSTVIIPLLWAVLGFTATPPGMAEAYRAGPAADRMVVRVSDPAGATTEVIEVLTVPGRAALVRFGAFRALVSRDFVVVERVDDATRAFVVPVTDSPGRTFREALPLVPVPQVALALDPDPDASLPWPFTDPDAAVDVRVLRSGRLRTIAARLDRGRSVRIRSEPIEGLGPEAFEGWTVDLDGRERVGSVHELATRSPNAGPARAGMKAPPLLLLGTDMAPWTLRSRETGAVAVVLCRGASPGAAAGLGAAWDVAEDEAAPLGYTAVIGVCVEPFEQRLIDQMRALREQWGDNVRWTVSPETTIDRFAPDASAVLVVIDALDTVRAVIPLDGRGDEQDELAGEIRDALSPKKR